MCKSACVQKCLRVNASVCKSVKAFVCKIVRLCVKASALLRGALWFKINLEKLICNFFFFLYITFLTHASSHGSVAKRLQ